MSNTKIKAGQFSGIVGNGTDGYFLMTNGDGTMAWEAAGTPSPTVTSVTYPGDDTAADPAGGQSVTLTGTNFASGATATIGGTTVPSVSFVSATELTITTPAKTAGDYDIVVTNTDGGTATFVDGISYNGIPSWTTASGSLGTFASDTTISTITLQASEPDAGTITFNITSGALPTGLSLTGANIDGTTSKETAETLYNFTVTAIDDENQSTPRAFSITVEKYILPAPENFEIVTYTGNGSTQSIEGKIGKAASFNGSSSKVTSTLSGFTGNPVFSISFWLNPSANNGTPIMFGNNSNGDAFLTYVNSSNKLNFGRWGDSLGNTTASIPNNTWTHVAISNNAGSVQVYINGTSDLSFSTTYSITNNNFYIGAANTAQYFNGKIDQVRIFDKALSQQEVTTLYNEDYDSSTKSTTDIFGDDSGVALYELDGDANDTGTGPYGTGAIDSGQSAVFNGSSSRVNLSSNPINGLTSVSFSFWLKPADISSYQYVLSFINQVDGWNGVGVRVSNTGKINIVRANNGAVTSTENSTSTLQLNVWQHIAVTVSQSSTVIYLDGNENGTFSSTPFTTNNTGSFDIGMNEYSPGVTQAFTEGSIDQVRIYSGILSASNVEALTSETNVPTANLVAHYKLDGNANDETTNYNGTASNVTYSDPAEFPLIQYNGTPTNVNFLGMAFQPDLVWIKPRSYADNNNLFDSIRGATKQLISNNTSGESTQLNTLQSFDSNGFTTGPDNNTNTSGSTYVAWCWKAGGAAVSNTDGSITSTVSANPDAGFSIVSYTGNGGGATLGHGLSQQVEMVITKSTESTSQWMIYHKDLTGNTSGDNPYNLYFSTDAELDLTAFGAYDSFTSSVFPVSRQSAATAHNNNINIDYIAYCFHSVDGYQKVGSYTGTGTSQEISVGFQPRFVMIKRATGGSLNGWVMSDSERGAGINLFANSNQTESNESAYGPTSFTSDGFTLAQAGGNTNVSGSTYIYLAIA